MKYISSKRQKIKSLLYKIFLGDTAPRKLFLFYLYAIIIGCILLALPISLKNVHEYVKYNADGTVHSYTFMDILFTSISAFSDTGLTTLDVSQTFSIFGQLVILFLIQVGGFGLFTIYWCFFHMMFSKSKNNQIKKVRFFDSIILFSERGNSSIRSTTKTIKYSVFFILAVEGIFWIIYSIYFALTPAYTQTTIESLITDPQITSLNYTSITIDTNNYVPYYKSPLAIWVGLFHSVSSINNAGFDIIGPYSLAPYRNDLGTILQFFTMIQIIIGGIGYPVIFDIIQKIKSKIHKTTYHISLFSKICLMAYFSLMLLGLIFLSGFEFGLSSGLYHQIKENQSNEYINAIFGKNDHWNMFSNILFSTISTRSAGFSAIAPCVLSDSSKWVMIILMFIGCSPSSTGGGVRVTTLAIIFAVLISRIKQAKQTIMFKKAISKQNIIDSFLIFIIGILLVSLFAVCLYPTISHNYLVTDLFFEFSSAFGTVGLTSGLSSELFYITKSQNTILALMLCIMMILGQVGISSTILSFTPNTKKHNQIYYPIEEIRI